MKGQRGFTLIEVLVALLVFGLIATAAAEVGSQYISSYERIRDKTLAGWVADGWQPVWLAGWLAHRIPTQRNFDRVTSYQLIV